MIVTKSGARIPSPNVGDYLIFRPERDIMKRALGRVMDNEGGDELVVNIENPNKPDVVTSIIGGDHVDINLGPKPETGAKIMGVDVEPWADTIEHALGTVRIFVRLGEKATKIFTDGLDDAAAVWNKVGLPPIPALINVRINKRSTLIGHGTYKASKTGPDMITLRLGRNSSKLAAFIMLHEMCHGLDHHYADSRLRAAWAALYNEQIVVAKATKAEIAHARMEMLGGTIEANDLNKAILSWLKDKRSLDRRHVMALAVSEEGAQILSDVWPSAVDLSDRQALVTEYALKNPSELFADTMAVVLYRHFLRHHTGHLLWRDSAAEARAEAGQGHVASGAKLMESLMDTIKCDCGAVKERPEDADPYGVHEGHAICIACGWMRTGFWRISDHEEIFEYVVRLDHIHGEIVHRETRKLKGIPKNASISGPEIGVDVLCASLSTRFQTLDYRNRNLVCTVFREGLEIPQRQTYPLGPIRNGMVIRPGLL